MTMILGSNGYVLQKASLDVVTCSQNLPTVVWYSLKHGNVSISIDPWNSCTVVLGKPVLGMTISPATVSDVKHLATGCI
jgi:hypothetical protein